MSVQVEKLEKNMAKLTIEVSAEELEKAITAAYNKQKNNFNIPGFRKGKVPQAMVEKMYGVEVFFEDAANTLMQNSYGAAAEESGLDIVSRPTVDVVQIERGKAFIYTAEVAVRPEVTLGQYKGVEVTKVEIEVTEEEVAARLEEERNKNTRTINVTDRAVVDGDTVVIDYAGSIDGVAFDGGTAEMQTLVIGSHSFIDTFEEQLIGHNIGDEVAVNVTFPEEYHAADLAGKPALFEVKIHEIKAKEVPELDDEFASDVSEFDTLEEYKEDLKKQLVSEKEAEAKVAKENEAIQKIVEASEMDIPEAMIKTQCESMVEQFADRIAQSGLTLEQYFQFSGQTMDKLLEQVRPEAEVQIKNTLVLDAVIAAEGIEATEEDVTAELTKMSEMYGMDVETIKGYMGEYGINSVKKELTVNKAIELIMANVVEA